MTAAEAARHPFLASLTGIGFWTPGGYPPVPVDSDEMSDPPKVDPDIKQMSLDSVSLLRRGTQLSEAEVRLLAQSSPNKFSPITSPRSSRKRRQGSLVCWRGVEANCSARQDNEFDRLLTRQFGQPQPAHRAAATSTYSADDTKPIDLTQPSPRSSPLAVNLSEQRAAPETLLPSVGLSPKTHARLDTIQRSYEQLYSQSQIYKNTLNQVYQPAKGTVVVNRSTKLSQSHKESHRNERAIPDRKLSKLQSSKPGPNGTNRVKPVEAAPQDASRRSAASITGMLGPLQNSMSKFLAAQPPRDERLWSARAHQEVSSSLGRSLGITSRPPIRNTTDPAQKTVSDKPNTSFALLANKIIKDPWSSSGMSGKIRRLEMNGVVSNNVPKSTFCENVKETSEMHPENSTSKINTRGEKKPTDSVSREPYFPDVSDISNSQSADEPVCSATARGRNSATNSTRDSKRSGADINANDVHVTSRMTNNSWTANRFEMMTDDSDDSEPEGDNANFVPLKKRKYYEKASEFGAWREEPAPERRVRNIYDFDPNHPASPVVKRSASRDAPLPGRTAAPAASWTQQRRKRGSAKKGAGGAAVTRAAGVNGARKPRRVSPRKHASTARLDTAAQICQNGTTPARPHLVR